MTDTVIKSSPRLYDFYVAYYGAVQEYDDTGDFTCDWTLSGGLCVNLFDYLRTISVGRHERDDLVNELHDQFKVAGLNTRLPFNTSVADYANDFCCSNPVRLAWVTARLADGRVG